MTVEQEKAASLRGRYLAGMSEEESSDEPRQYFKVAIADMPINHYTHVEVTGICTGTKLVQGNTRGRSDSCMELTHIEVLKWIEQGSFPRIAVNSRL